KRAGGSSGPACRLDESPRSLVRCNMGPMDRVAESAPPRLRRARPSVVDTSDKIARNGAKAAAVPARYEWGIAIAALFVLGRWPVLFFRLRLAHSLGTVALAD